MEEKKEGGDLPGRSDSAGSVAAGSDSSGSFSSFESGDEEILSATSPKLASSDELVKIFGNISVGSSANSNISSHSDSVDTFDFIDRSTSIREVFTDLYDGVTDIDENQASTHHQVFAIGEASRAEPETSKAFDDLGNPYVDPADLTRGLGTKYLGPEPRDKVQLPQEAWDRATRAMNGTEPMNTTATVAELQAYQYRLARKGRELEKQTAELERRRAATSVSSRRRAELSRHSGTSGDNHRDGRNRARSRLQNIPEADRENLIQNLDMSFVSIDTRGNIIPKTPEAGYMATHAFILANRPPAGDPREALYNMALAGVRVIRTAFASTSTPPEGAARQNSPRPTAAVQPPPRTSASDTVAQTRVDRARQERRERRQSPEVDDEDLRTPRVPDARGIEANPEKIQAIVTIRKPTKLKEIQQLTGRVTALSRFVARLGERALPFYALIKQGEKFEWNEEADRSFEDLKRTISTPPILVAPKEKEPLLLYIAATPQVVSMALVVEREEEGKLHGWGLDMVGKLHKAWPGGYEYMLVAVDKFTKWVEAKPINSPDAASAVKFIKSIVFSFQEVIQSETNTKIKVRKKAFTRS
ncbi:hypothetical protein QYE76_052977 [Lolium multiflorum]|uniref:Reverse transcriptase/retrotransposon-derived protein RNase H-like domain-containing protein n=1 Tax=Lolium multiflorum TaxID=4521 RepID=A0AAD8SWK6_LOLMU|nr:hypothetical protein QYE76_052977 [Lolium multiflorum]